MDIKEIKEMFDTILDNYVKTEEGFRFKCKYNGTDFPKCPNNEDGICKTIYKTFPSNLIHEFDGKNIIKCLCG